MTIAVYSTHKFEQAYLEKANAAQHTFKFITSALCAQTVDLARGCEAVSLFVNDDASAAVIELLHNAGVKFIALRSAGYNNVALSEAKKYNIKVARVAAYSPYSVAEHAVTLMLALNRKIIRAHNRVMEQNFTLDGLVGFDMHGKTVGIIGTGKIGAAVATIMNGFGCKILLHDTIESDALKKIPNATYTNLLALYNQADIITLHVPLVPATKYLIDKHAIEQMKKGVMLINTSRGGLVNTKAAITALKTGQIGYLGIDVYEEESGLFFEDHSTDILKDDVIARLMTFNNVLITSHQAFLTNTALTNIATTTVQNITCFENNSTNENEL
jgi:D-lactate dehydrogenase